MFIAKELKALGQQALTDGLCCRFTAKELKALGQQVLTDHLYCRFTAKELKALGQQVLKLLLMEKDVDLFFGQQTVFRPSLPDCFDLVGTNKAFLTYDKRLFKVI